MNSKHWHHQKVGYNVIKKNVPVRKFENVNIIKSGWQLLEGFNPDTDSYNLLRYILEKDNRSLLPDTMMGNIISPWYTDTTAVKNTPYLYKCKRQVNNHLCFKIRVNETITILKKMGKYGPGILIKL